MNSKFTLNVGEEIAHYSIVRQLGIGGMGEVYHVRHTILGTEYALKILPPHVSHSEDAQMRFRQEARVMARLASPRIVQVDDIGVSNDISWIRMELAQGVATNETGGTTVVTLDDMAQIVGGRISEQTLMGFLLDICEAMECAHDKGVTHRDLKPANILLSFDEHHAPRAKVTDFGLVQVVGDEWLQTMIQRSMSIGNAQTMGGNDGGPSSAALLGTYDYMSPEQRVGAEVDQRSDIYALGILIFRMLTGTPVLGFQLPSQLCSSVNTAWDGIVSDCVRPKREDRLQKIHTLHERLATLANTIGVTTFPHGARNEQLMSQQVSQNHHSGLGKSFLDPRRHPIPAIQFAQREGRAYDAVVEDIQKGQLMGLLVEETWYVEQPPRDGATQTPSNLAGSKAPQPQPALTIQEQPVEQYAQQQQQQTSEVIQDIKKGKLHGVLRDAQWYVELPL